MTTPLIQSVDRSLEILRLVASSEKAVSLQQLSSAMNLNPTTVFNIARTLVARDFLTKVPQPAGYLLGPAIAELLSANQKNSFERRATETILTLSKQLRNATIVLSKLIAGQIVITMRSPHDQPGTLQRPSQQTLSPYTSASSLAFLAFADLDAKERYYKLHPFEDYAPPKWANQKELDTFLDNAKKVGYVKSCSGNNLFLGVPVFPGNGEIFSILGVSITTNGDCNIINQIIDKTVQASKKLMLSGNDK